MVEVHRRGRGWMKDAPVNVGEYHALFFKVKCGLLVTCVTRRRCYEVVDSLLKKKVSND